MKRRKIVALLLTLLAGWAGKTAGALDRGTLVLIGGGLEASNRALYQTILEARLEERPICILPIASAEPREAAEAVRRELRRYGGRKAAEILMITEAHPEAVTDRGMITRIGACGGLFFTGGDQSRIVDVLRPAGRDTPAAMAMRDLFDRGGVVVGTSAGAAMMSDPMIAGGSSDEALAHGVTRDEAGPGVWLRTGMGFLRAGLVDQHALVRGRLGRLLVATATLEHTRRGFAIDENTGLVILGTDARVVGTSAVVLLDLETALTGADGHGIRNGRLWLLGDGDHCHLPDALAWPREDKEALTPLPAGSLPASEAPWEEDGFYRLLRAFAVQDRDEVAIGAGTSRLVLRKGTGYRAAAAAGKPGAEPRALFAGPFIFDWLPEEIESP